jgi:hypothetical protein
MYQNLVHLHFQILFCFHAKMEELDSQNYACVIQVISSEEFKEWIEMDFNNFITSRHIA